MNTADLRQHLNAGGAALFDLGGRAKFTLTGADRIRYLNGQVSNNVRRLESEEAQRNGGAVLPACVMNAKGKMDGLVWIGAGVDKLRLDADPGDNLEAFREIFAARLERYIISDDVELTDTTDELQLLHLLGVGGSPEKLGPLPDGVEWRCSRRYGRDGIDLMAPVGPFDLVTLLVGKGSELSVLSVDAATEEVFRIEQGIPRWGAELDENTLPPEAGLDASAIDFHKGCYIGQEVISRIKSVGRVNRHLCGFVAGEPLEQGTPVRDGDREVGVLTSTAWSFALDKAVALGYLKRGAEVSRLMAGATEVEVRELPLID